MEYKALYRKYRPSSFKEVVGQNIITKTLGNAVMNNKISHAYIFNGPRGTGKTSVAKILAHLINCKERKGATACGKCDFCVEYNKNEIIDIVEMDAASNNGVDEIREIKTKVNIVPGKGKFKVYIIDEVHMLSAGAFNALLKTLEEPPPHVIFILATTEIHKVPSTVISRCQRFDFKRVSVESIKSKLKHIAEVEKINIADQALTEIARFSDGGVRDAISTLDLLISYKNKKITKEDVYEVIGTVSRDTLLDLITKVIKKDLEGLLCCFQQIANDGKDFARVGMDLMNFTKNSLIYSRVPHFFCEQGDNTVYYKTKTEDEQTLLLALSERFNGFINRNQMGNAKDLLEIELISFIYSKTELQSSPLPLSSAVAEGKNSNPKSDSYYLEKMKEVRINNALALANKEKLNLIKQKWPPSLTGAGADQYRTVVGLIRDASIYVAGGQYLLLAFKYQSAVDRFNDNIKQIEELLETVFNEKYNVVAVSENEWSKIKKEYLKTIKSGGSYQVVEEPCLEDFDDPQHPETVKLALNVLGGDLVEIK